MTLLTSWRYHVRRLPWQIPWQQLTGIHQREAGVRWEKLLISSINDAAAAAGHEEIIAHFYHAQFPCSCYSLSHCLGLTAMWIFTSITPAVFYLQCWCMAHCCNWRCGKQHRCKCLSHCQSVAIGLLVFLRKVFKILAISPSHNRKPQWDF